MATIKTPVEGFTGTVAGVAFADGVGHTEDAAALAYFRRHGYTIEQALPEAVEGDEGLVEAPATGTPMGEAEGDELIDFESMTVDQLKAFAAEHEYTLGEATKKADIIEAIASQIPAVEGTPTE